MPAKSTNTAPDFSAFFSAFRGETDRAAAVLGAAYVDVALERLIRARMVEKAPDSLFESRGPLGDFAAKIDVTYSLGWIPDWLKADLHIVRRIRNDFAHDADHTLSFDSDSVRDRAYALRVAEHIETLISAVASANEDRARADEVASQMRAGLLGTARKRLELAVVNGEIFLGNLTRRSHHALEDTSTWTIMHLGTVDGPISADDPIPLSKG